jgi:hypothetical protein
MNRQVKRTQSSGQAAAPPTFDKQGMSDADMKQYRGRQSYEQQASGGDGGQSGAFDQKETPGDYPERYRPDDRDPHASATAPREMAPTGAKKRRRR